MDRRQPRVAVLGGGSWGTTMASIVARSAPTVLWARSPEVAEEVDRRGRSKRLHHELPVKPPPDVTAEPRARSRRGQKCEFTH